MQLTKAPDDLESGDQVRRAVNAYIRTDGAANIFREDSSGDVVELDGRRYVRLFNADGIFAIYRVRRSDGILKRLKRWPAELER